MRWFTLLLVAAFSQAAAQETTIGALLAEGRGHRLEGRLDEAGRAFREALDAAERSGPAAADQVAVAASNLGLVYRAAGRHSESEALFRRAAAIWERILGPNHPEEI